MAEIIFSDIYRTFLLCFLSACIAFGARNATKRKRVLAFLGYEAIMLMPFLWIFVVAIAFTYSGEGSLIDIVLWELQWILYFTVITILQFATYHLLWKNNKVFKALALLLCIIIVAGSLSILIYNNLIY